MYNENYGCRCPASPIPIAKRLSSMFFCLSKISHDCSISEYMSTSVLFFSWGTCLFCVSIMLFSLLCFCNTAWIQECKDSTFISLRIYLDIWGLLWFQMKLISFAISLKNCFGIFIGIALNLQITFRKKVIFTILFLNHKQ